LTGLAVDLRSMPKAEDGNGTAQTPSVGCPKSNHSNVQTCNGTHE